jgi:DNA polymerase-4
MAASRHILHVDMDAFFASIAQRDQPELRGKAVLTGGTGPRAVVTSASYEARPYGCRSAMPMAIARRRCPHAVVVKVPGARIREMSRRVFDIFHSVTPMVQPMSVDEAFLDVTGSVRLLGPPEAIAAEIRRRLRTELGVTGSVGIAFNKFLAKLSSDMHKPDGQTLITPQNLDDVLLPLPVSRIWGVGPAAAQRLASQGIRTVADLRRFTPEQLERRLGSHGEQLYRLCRGIDDRPVTADREAKSIGNEHTFDLDVEQRDVVHYQLLQQAEHVGLRLRRQGFFARGVTVKIRFGDFQTITRASTLDRPTNLTADLHAAGRAIFDHWASEAFSPVRLIGLTATHLAHEPPQLDLFPDPGRVRQQQVDRTLDQITAKFGSAVVHRGARPDRHV